MLRAAICVLLSVTGDYAVSVSAHPSPRFLAVLLVGSQAHVATAARQKEDSEDIAQLTSDDVASEAQDSRDQNVQAMVHVYYNKAAKCMTTKSSTRGTLETCAKQCIEDSGCQIMTIEANMGANHWCEFCEGKRMNYATTTSWKIYEKREVKNSSAYEMKESPKTTYGYCIFKTSVFALPDSSHPGSDAQAFEEACKEECINAPGCERMSMTTRTPMRCSGCSATGWKYDKSGATYRWFTKELREDGEVIMSSQFSEAELRNQRSAMVEGHSNLDAVSLHGGQDSRRSVSRGSQLSQDSRGSQDGLHGVASHELDSHLSGQGSRPVQGTPSHRSPSLSSEGSKDGHLIDNEHGGQHLGTPQQRSPSLSSKGSQDGHERHPGQGHSGLEAASVRSEDGQHGHGHIV